MREIILESTRTSGNLLRKKDSMKSKHRPRIDEVYLLKYPQDNLRHNDILRGVKNVMPRELLNMKRRCQSQR